MEHHQKEEAAAPTTTTEDKKQIPENESPATTAAAGNVKSTNDGDEAQTTTTAAKKRSSGEGPTGRTSRSNSLNRNPKAWKVKGAEGDNEEDSAATKENSHQGAPQHGNSQNSGAHKQRQGQRKQDPGQRKKQQTTESEDEADSEIDDTPVDGHKLQTPWTFWFSRKDKKRTQSLLGITNAVSGAANKQNNKDHREKLVQMGTVRSIEEFWHHFTYMKRATQLVKESNLYFFRKQLVPMWETFPKGGCFIIRVKKQSGVLDRMWEELLFAAIGEAFEEPNVVGVVVSIRSKEDAVSIWTRTNQQQIRYRVGEKLKHILNLEKNSVVMFKSNATSMKDRSTYKNAQKLLIAS